MSKSTATSINQPSSQIATMTQTKVIKPTTIEWQTDDTGNKVPVSGEFGDVYFSHADGLAESRHVFLQGNRLAERLADLVPRQCFTIAELGFGTGLNLLAVWQLWRQLRAAQPHLATARLHFITTEKHPIALADLTQILRLWGQRAPELIELIESLLASYPTLIEGCHRLNFYDDNLRVDIWLGDAADSLAKLETNATYKNHPQLAYIDAWFLDGFAPSCNESLWAETIFAQLQRLSDIGTTAATYSCAGVVKRALQGSGFQISKVKGFGRKRHMLTAIRSADTWLENDIENDTQSLQPPHTIIIGAGVSGLMMAWSLARRGIKVTLLDKVAPLAGASGNPRVLLAPMMTPIHHVDEHLHTIGYLYSSRLYRQLNERAIKDRTTLVLEPTGALDLLIKANVDNHQIAKYPEDIATTLSAAKAKDLTALDWQDLTENLYLPQSGLINPQALKDIILAYPLITYQPLEVGQITETETQVTIVGYDIVGGKDDEQLVIEADNAIICAAYESHYLDARIFDCCKIRGQLSWFIPTVAQWTKLPTLPLKYSGYCAPFTAQTGDASLNNIVENQQYLLLGSSFVRDDVATDIRIDEHQMNRDKIVSAIPELEDIIPTDTSRWQARAGVRTQTPDYHPIVGQLSDSKRLWTLSAMGAKGYAIAPICAEALADMILGEFAPLSMIMLKKLSPNRTKLTTPLS